MYFTMLIYIHKQGKETSKPYHCGKENIKMLEIIIKNAETGVKHTLKKFVNETVDTPIEYLKTDLLLANDKETFLKENTNLVVDSQSENNGTLYLKCHVNWEENQDLYNEEGDLVKTETITNTVPYLIIIG